MAARRNTSSSARRVGSHQPPRRAFFQSTGRKSGDMDCRAIYRRRKSRRTRVRSGDRVRGMAPALPGCARRAGGRRCYLEFARPARYDCAMRLPVGFLITWTCHGTWLYGDARGSVDDEHNAYRTPHLPSNDRRVCEIRRSMNRPEFRLSRPARVSVERTITDHCRRREWELLAVNARSNHVHVVVRFAGVAPEIMMGQLRAWSSRRLREKGLLEFGRQIWTRHGSTRYLWKERDLKPAVQYVVDGQDASRFGEKQDVRRSEHRAQVR